MKNVISGCSGITMFCILQILGYTEDLRLFVAFNLSVVAALGMLFTLLVSKGCEKDFIKVFEKEKEKLFENSGGRAVAEYEKSPEGFFVIRIYIQAADETEIVYLSRRYAKIFHSYEFKEMVTSLQVLSVKSLDKVDLAREFMKKDLTNKKSF